MTLVALAFSLLIVAFGVWGLLSPSAMIGLVRRFMTPVGFYFAAALRVLMGVVLVFAAPTSQVPQAISIVGVVVIIAGVAMPVIGLRRIEGMVDWWAEQDVALIRWQAAFALVFGAWLIFVLLPLQQGS